MARRSAESETRRQENKALQAKREPLVQELRALAHDTLARDGFFHEILAGYTDTQREVFFDVVAAQGAVETYGMTTSEERLVEVNRDGNLAYVPALNLSMLRKLREAGIYDITVGMLENAGSILLTAHRYESLTQRES